MNLAERIDNFLSPFAQRVNAIVFFEIPLFGVDVPLVVIMLFGMAILLTLALGFINFRGFRHSIHILTRRFSGQAHPGELSHVQALSAALSGTIGNGNIASVPVALILGGPGALFWMSLAAFFGMTSKFAECMLAVKYRRRDEKGRTLGGPMYTMDTCFKRFGLPWVGKIFAIVFSIGTIGASFSLLQINQAHAQFASVTGISVPILFSVLFSALVFIVVVGGARRLGFVTSYLVPAMSGLYIFAALFIVFYNFEKLPAVFGMIFNGVFGFDAAAGGAVGAMINGIKRATYSSEAGVGSSAIAHATVKTSEPATEGYVAMLEPFLDTLIICNLTGLAILASGVYAPFLELPPESVKGVEVTSAAFAQISGFMPYILMLSLCMFAVSTLISWAYYGVQAVAYLSNNSNFWGWVYKVFLFLILCTGASIKLSSVILFTDSMLFMMAIPNMITVLILLPEIRTELRGYHNAIRRKKAPA